MENLKKKMRLNDSKKTDTSPKHIIIPEDNINKQMMNQMGTAVITTSNFDANNFFEDFMLKGGRECIMNYQNENGIPNGSIDLNNLIQMYSNNVSMNQTFVSQEGVYQMGYPVNENYQMMNNNNMNSSCVSQEGVYQMGYGQNFSTLNQNYQGMDPNIQLMDFSSVPNFSGEDSSVYDENEYIKCPMENFPEFEIPRENAALAPISNIPDPVTNITQESISNIMQNTFSNMFQGLSFSIKGAKMEDGKMKSDFEGNFNSRIFSGSMIGYFDSSGFHANFDAKFI